MTHSARYDTEHWRPLVKKYFPDSAVNTALAVMRVESGGDPTAHNLCARTGDDSWGLYQINRYGKLKNRPQPEWLTTPENNIEYAAAMYHSQGWTPWTTTAIKLGLTH